MSLFPRFKHKTPCNECPWRRAAPAGWLGGYQPEAFTDQVHRDGPPVPCHKTIPPGGDMTKAVSMCAGALIHMKNSCKRAFHPAYGDALDKVERDPEGVFNWPHEFIEHHHDREGWAKRATAKAVERQARKKAKASA